jgi:hypothetical protein
LPRGFVLGSSRSLPSGIVVNIYKPIPTLAEEAVSRAKLEREFEIAREVQERLFPQTFPNVAGVDMAAHCRPAQAVGGDYYDLIDIHGPSLPEAGQGCDRLGVAIGDISGKGMSAALLMASLHASLRGQVLSGTGDLGAKMTNVNRLLYAASDSNRWNAPPAPCTTSTEDTILLRCSAKRTAPGVYSASQTAAPSSACLPVRSIRNRYFTCSPAMFCWLLPTALAKP